MLLNNIAHVLHRSIILSLSSRSGHGVPNLTLSHLLVWTYRERRVGLNATRAFLWVSQRQHHLTDLNSNNKKVIECSHDRIASNNANSLLQVRNALWVFQGERRRGTKSIRARVRARENHMKPFVRTSFLGTRPSCLPSPGRPLFAADDRKPILWLGAQAAQ